jgi:hypothetical protein
LVLHRICEFWLSKGSRHSLAAQANFSANAWGDMKRNDKNKSWTLKGMANFELGVFFEGPQLKDLVVGGDWQRVLTYERPAQPYAKDDKPVGLAFLRVLG